MQQCNEVGVDVGSKTLVLQLKTAKTGNLSEATFENNTSGHKKLLKYITKRGSTARVCLEATGIYHFDLSIFLHKSKKVEVMLANPRAIKNFAKAVMKRAKTDKSDAEVILKYLQVCDFVRWIPPRDEHIALQRISRRMHQIKGSIQREQNRLHAEESCDKFTKVVNKDINKVIKFLEQQQQKLEVEAMKLIESDLQLSHMFERVTSVKGIAVKSAISIISELACMPKDMTSSQWVAHAGLDPRVVESGESINKPRRISKAGNKYLRAALYMPSWVAVQKDPHVRAYYIKLRKRNVLKMKAITAVSRKMLISIWGILHNDQPWISSKFHVEQVPLTTELP